MNGYLYPDNNPLKQLWLSNNNSSLCYAMYDNQNVLLRGSRGILLFFISTNS